MRLYRFDTAVGHPVGQFDSCNVIISGILRNAEIAHIGCFHLEPGGMIGRHPATLSQLLLVVSGSGWVSGDSQEQVDIAAGQAAFWNHGESHETGTDTGLMALVIEGKTLAPESFMPEL